MNAPDRTVSWRPRIQLESEALRPTRAEVDLDAIAHNYRVVRDVAGSAKVLAVIKADAYGHGVVPVASRLESEGAFAFGVALAEEGLELREAGIRAGILVLNGVYGHAHAEVLESGLTPVIYDLGQLEAFDRAAPHRTYRVHLKIDTGMSRLGVPARELPRFLEALASHPRCVIDGLMTHLSSADSNDEATLEQLLLFESARRLVHSFGHAPRLVHAANTAATMRRRDSHFDLVRPGGALFGIEPKGRTGPPLVPAMRLRSEIIAMRDLEEGQTVGYDATFVARRATRLATVAIGYGDGLLRALGNRGAMLVRGVRCPIAGRVSMDLTMIDVTDIEGACVGDEVVALGTQSFEGRRATLDADSVAADAGTISYDVLTSISRRVPRSYRP